MRASVPMVYTSHKVLEFYQFGSSGVAIKHADGWGEHSRSAETRGWKFYPHVRESAIFSKSCSTHLAVVNPRARRRSGKEWT